MIGDKEGIRPIIKSISELTYNNPGEAFQNLTLRPILKLQHELLMVYVQGYFKKNKIELLGYDTLKKKAILSNCLKNDLRFKTELRGMIIGQFTADEYRTYEGMATDMNKRIMAMLEERLQSVPL